MNNIKKYEFAGKFYSNMPQTLFESILGLYNSTIGLDDNDFSIRSRLLIVPHAGYIYSGIVALNGYRVFSKNKEIKKLLIIGPSHNYLDKGIIISNYDYFASPLGILKVDKDIYQSLSKIENIKTDNNIFENEHSIEVHLPIINSILNIETIFPILISGDIDYSYLKKYIFELMKNDESVGVVFSSDLSHFLEKEKANQIDEDSVNDIFDGKYLSTDRACGSVGINLFIDLCENFGYNKKIISYLDSGEITGDYNSVVGYVSMIAGLEEKGKTSSKSS